MTTPSGDGDRADHAEPPAWLRRGAGIAFYAVALLFVVRLLRYYTTGAGGPTLLAVSMLPVAYVIATLDDLRRGQLYPRLGAAGGAIVGTVLITVAVAAGLYLNAEFEAIRITRLARWNAWDLAAGGALIALLLEFARRKYLPLFVLNLILIAYVVYGYHVPGLFNHPGLPWRRVVTALSLETATGIFEQLPQIALTLIGSFILVLAVLRAFGAIDSILKAASRLAARSPHLLPQAAVVGSFGVAAVSGSGAANAATTGSVTIPALIRAGLPKVRAAAIETAGSLGGQLMPPLMGIAAFLMADFMGVSYFDVVARGFAPAIIYFLGVSLAVYLLSARFQASGPVPDPGTVGLLDKVNLAAYGLAIAGLIYLMGVVRWPPMQAAQRVFLVLFVSLGALFLVRRVRRPENQGRAHLADLVRPFGSFVETFSRMTSELTLLLAILSILTAAFTITGVPTKVGFVLLELGGFNVAVLALVAFAFGYVVGMGLPPAPTYIIVAVVIAPFMISAGLDRWVVHFYAFLIAVFGELSPPTSVTAAVTSRIADASFMRTMFRALEMCMPLLLLMVGLFAWPALVLEPGVAQLVPAAMVLVATLGVIVSLHGHFFSSILLQWLGKATVAVMAAALVLGPPLPAAGVLAAGVLACTVFSYVRTRRLAGTTSAGVGPASG